MMIDFTSIEAIILAYLPTLTSVIAMFVALFKILGSLNKLKENEQLKKERDELVAQNKATLAECKKMRKQMALYIQKVAKVHYEDMTEVQNDKDLQI